eukprot:XP_027304454.1 neurofilament heavy polypeptide-like [Anas platyrhynchos]
MPQPPAQRSRRFLSENSPTPERDSRPAEDSLLAEDSTSVEDILPAEDRSPAEDSLLAEYRTPVEAFLPSEDSSPAEDSLLSEDSTSVEDILPSEDSSPAEDSLLSEDSTSVEDILPAEDSSPVEDRRPAEDIAQAAGSSQVEESQDDVQWLDPNKAWKLSADSAMEFIVKYISGTEKVMAAACITAVLLAAALQGSHTAQTPQGFGPAGRGCPPNALWCLCGCQDDEEQKMLFSAKSAICAELSQRGVC